MNTFAKAAAHALRRLNPVYFDLDKTLADTGDCHENAWHTGVAEANQKFPSELPIEITPEFLRFQVGRSNDGAVRFLGIDPASERGRTLIESKKRAAVANAHHARWFDDALTVLPELSQRGYDVAIVTSSTRKFVECIIEKHDALRFLRTRIVSREDYEHPKPAADCLIRASQVLGIPLANAVYIGDALVDYETTKAAGCSFLLYSPEGEAVQHGLESVPRIKSHLEIWQHV